MTEETTSNYDSFNVEMCEKEIARLTKLNMDFEQSKKDYAASYNKSIKLNKGNIKLLVERIDYLHHENAVANILEQ